MRPIYLLDGIAVSSTAAAKYATDAPDNDTRLVVTIVLSLSEARTLQNCASYAASELSNSDLEPSDIALLNDLDLATDCIEHDNDIA